MFTVGVHELPLLRVRVGEGHLRWRGELPAPAQEGRPASPGPAGLSDQAEEDQARTRLQPSSRSVTHEIYNMFFIYKIVWGGWEVTGDG